MATGIKICGLRSAESVEHCLKLGVEFVGFTVYPASPRHVSPQEVSALLPLLEGGNTSSVLVTVDADPAIIETYFNHHRVNFIQCHGKESPAQLEALRKRFDVGIIKAISVSDGEDVKAAEAYFDSADMLLFDAKPSRVDLPGGNAKRFDWSLLEDVHLPLPWLLSGGLDAQNVQQAIALTHPTAVDVSSGVEAARGIKDNNEIENFVRHVRA